MQSQTRIPPPRSSGASLADWRPDRASPQPIYAQIAGYFRAKITGGDWPEGMKLPPQRELARQLGVNRSTVVAALGQLAELGLIEGRQGGGTRVAGKEDPPWTAGSWNDYVEEGTHYPNLPAIQAINRLEFQPELLRLGTGEPAPELLPGEEMRSILAELAREELPLPYEEPLGSLRLRRAVSAELGRIGIRAEPSSILILSGALQGIQLVSLGLLPKGAAVLLEKPSYLYSIHSFQSAGVKLHGLPMDKRGLVTEGLEDLAARAKAAVLYTIPSFHNPTGILMDAERRRELMERAAALGLPVLEDGAYQDLWLDAPPPLPLKALDGKGQVLHLGTLSKSASPGLRIGWVAGPEQVIRRLADIKMQTDYGASSLSQLAAAKWLEDGGHKRHTDALRLALRRRRDLMLELLERHFTELAEWSKPAGGFYVWLRLNKPLPLPKLFRAALAEGLLLNTGDLYDRADARHLRLSYAYASPSGLEQGIFKLAELVRRMDRLF
ncbi:GntR family transcriptional regulator of abcA and norABC [Paenibacillus forsythiae]|uniref:GntR family transcriptional regulator of abcA and norABC n=1 Tax=Paenibacillus forsythiae TaxID=365616 RepID=A0ABU3H3Y4_9BACL|nr:PLP-dependent aminotransferase family protein [Paenibacillus forsythiae]MDT3425531.1 GntR family transcriptional regulator of abcA and norABC [Paenibacillus forsythiae]